MAGKRKIDPAATGAASITVVKDGHKSSIFYCENGLQNLKDAIIEVAEAVSRAEWIPIKVDEYLCEEAHARAKETLGFHKVAAYSAYKEIAHIGFWLNRLKPIRIDSPMNVFRVMRAGRTLLDEWLVGKWTALEKKASTEEEKLRHKMDFPVNEYVVVTLIMEFIEASQTAHASNLGGVHREDFERAIADAKMREPWLRNRLQTSLRDHNHSARGFATLVEATFRTRCEKD